MAKLEKEPTYNIRLEALETFFVVQLIDSSNIKGSEAKKIGDLREKFQKSLDTHFDKTGDFVGYQPPNTEIVSTPPEV